MAAMLVAQIANNQHAANHLIKSQEVYSCALPDKK